MKKIAFIIIVCIITLSAGLYFGLQYQKQQQAHLSAIELPDTLGQMQSASAWLGKIVVVNHWATWCPPCREEIPMLTNFYSQMRDKDIMVVGISHDYAEQTRLFGDQIGINYPSLVIGYNGGELLRAHGNENAGALPYTVIFDQQGKIAASHLGLLKRPDLDALIKPLLKNP